MTNSYVKITFTDLDDGKWEKLQQIESLLADWAFTLTVDLVSVSAIGSGIPAFPVRSEFKQNEQGHSAVTP